MRKKRITKRLSILTITTVLSSLTSMALPLPVHAASCNWTGGSGDWETPGNWSCGSVPDEDDDVTIDANVTVDINESTTINSLTLGDVSGTYSPTLNFDYDAISDGALTLDDGNVTLYSGATVTHTDAVQDTKNGTVYLNLQSGNATISGSINTNNKGYTKGIGTDGDGYGPGGGDAGGIGKGGGGGGYGGFGANATSGASGGSRYGAIETYELGSGGGGAYSSRDGGDGGGAIKFVATGNVSVLGSIVANGQNGEAANDGGGGGSGGFIFLETGVLSGSGTIQANGGNGYNKGGGGGGGRIYISYTSSSFSGTLQSIGGSGGNTGNDGTLLKINSSSNHAYIEQNQTWSANSSLEGGSHASYDNITVANSSTWILAGYYTTGTNGIGHSFDVENFTIDSGSMISGVGYGYASGYGTNASGTGPGAGGGGGGGQAGGGAGYGGSGGSSGGSGGSTYGSEKSPNDIGSGGGGGYNGGYGGPGGSALKINASETVEINGDLLMDGRDAYSGGDGGGGGSGGSIWIISDTLSGNGTIYARGGDGYNKGGGGGGGRISIEYITSNNWSGNTLNNTAATAKGVSGPNGGNDGSDGTVNLNQMSTGYVTNLSGTLNAYRSSDWSTDMEQSGNATAGYQEIGVGDASDRRIAEFTVKIDGNLDWTNVTGDIDTDDLKSYFHVPSGFSNIDGYDSSYPSYTLYVPKGTGTRVGICPGVSSFNDINSSCTSLTYYSSSDPNVSIVFIAGVRYWKVSGLTSTGGFSAVEDITDIMTRLQVSADSNHEIIFSTSNGIDLNTDTITLEFDPSGQAFDLSSITVSDIDLEDDGADKTLAGSAGAGTWGVSINTSTDIITFTAPTDTAADEIADDSVITIKIGTNADGGSNQIVNPSSAGQYEIEMRMNTADSEYGIIEVAIVDDDTVNITSYIDSFILFDIDTADVDIDCDAAGGTSPCDSHSGAADDSGYVVDLGEMSYLSVNASGDSVTHADGNAGNINYIYFDLSTNATGGATVTIISLNGSLDGSGTNTIPSVTNDGDGVTISAGDGAYGIREVSNSATAGSFTVAGDYDGGASIFGECTTSATQIFSTTSTPMDTGRLQMQVGASPDSSDGTGTYTDTLTFIVTSTF